jgi:hypothetical protein
MKESWGQGERKKRPPEGESREPFRLVAVEEDVQERRGTPGPQPGPRFGEEERRRMADLFVLLDQLDRAHAARRERKAAA